MRPWPRPASTWAGWPSADTEAAQAMMQAYGGQARPHMEKADDSGGTDYFHAPARFINHLLDD
jgi:hypothetical protein